MNQLKQHKSQIIWLLRECPNIFQINSAIALNQEQVKHFNEKGCLGPIDTFSRSEINTVLDYLESNVAVHLFTYSNNLIANNLPQPLTEI